MLYQLSYYRLTKKSQNCWCPDSEELERADSRTRTGDPRITNALLYQLSHIGNFSMISCSKAGAKVQKKMKSEK